MLRSSGGWVPETDSAVCPSWWGARRAALGERRPPLPTLCARPEGAGMCGEGSLQANRATMGPLNDFQNKGDTDLTVAQRAAGVGVARRSRPGLGPGLSALPAGLAPISKPPR